MKIAIEAQRIFRRDKHGMDFVILEVLRQLQRLDTVNQYVVFVAPGPDRCLASTANIQVVELQCPTYPLWEQFALPRAVARIGADLLHCTSNTAPLHCPVPLIVTLHDIIYLEPRQHRSSSLYQEMGWHYRRLVVPHILTKCRHVITVSRFERQRICQALQLPSSLVTAVYNGYNPRFQMLHNPDIQVLQRLMPAYEPEKGFLFFLGNTDPKKNTARVLQAYALYLEQSSVRRPLLIADLQENTIDTLLRQERITAIKPYLHFPGYISNIDLPMVYNAAFAFLYPSLRESFGIPLLEAMACGTPVITSRTSAMPEVAGEGNLLIDPYQPREIADALLRLERNEAFRRQQVSYGLERVKQFSWEETARQYLQIYKKTFLHCTN